MLRIFRYRVAILAAVLALTSAASAQQQPGTQKKRVPTMSSDDLPAASSSTMNSDATTAGDAPPGWNRYSIDGCGLSIALPVDPVTTDLPIPEAAKGLGVSGTNHIAVAQGYTVVIQHMQSPINLEMKPFAEGLMRGVSSTPGLTNLQYKLLPGGSATRMRMAGSWAQQGIPLAFEGFAEVRGKHAWSVLAVHEASNKSADEPVKKAIESAKFDGPECP